MEMYFDVGGNTASARALLISERSTLRPAIAAAAGTKQVQMEREQQCQAGMCRSSALSD
jgi:hypothetical protein